MTSVADRAGLTQGVGVEDSTGLRAVRKSMVNAVVFSECR